MNNFKKVGLSALAGSLAMVSAQAVEYSVAGDAQAVYSSAQGNENATEASNGKGIGVDTDLAFTGSGDLDNGWSWSYAVDYDPSDSAATASDGNANGVDDSQLKVTTPYGTFGAFITEGGMRAENAASQSVYGRPSDIGVSTGLTAGYDIDSYNNIQYHTPAGILPFGITAKVGYATGLSNNINSSNAVGEAPSSAGDAATIYRVDATPLDGLTVGADYFQINGAKLDGSDTVMVQSGESGSVYATYAFGAAKVGASKTYIAPTISRTATEEIGSTIRETANTKYSIAYNLNDATSISYEKEKSATTAILNSTAVYDQSSYAIELAHNLGGMTIGVVYAQHDNVGYRNNNDIDQVLLSVNMAF